MIEKVALFSLPIGVFLFHLGFSKLSMWYLSKGAKQAVGLINLILYPVVVSLLLALFFRTLLTGAPTGLFPSWVGGIAGYYMSLILGILPFSGPFFREIDLEFMLLALGVVEGSRAGSFKELGSLMSSNTLSHWGLMFGAILGALILSMITKYLVTRSMGYYEREEEMVKGFVWGISIASGMVTIPVVLFFMMLSK